MSVRVLLRDGPHRTLALATSDAALVFRHSHQSPNNASQDDFSNISASGNLSKSTAPPQCMVEFASRDSLNLNEYRTVGSAHGTLGLITLNNDVFLCVVTGSSQVANVRPGETVQKIHAVEFHCLNRSQYDYMRSGREENPYPGSTFGIDDRDYGGAPEEGDSETPFEALQKLLSNGFFYYSVDFDLTSRLQQRANDESNFDISSLDEGLLWNSYMIEPLLQFRSRLADSEREALDKSRILTSVIRGFVKTIPVPPASAPLRRQVSNKPSMLTIISRLSARRAGTRFNSRGIDDDGNVANFVETETVFWSPAGICFSYVQVRGSVPIFWESSSSLIPGQQKIAITRPPAATQPAFDKHFENLELAYGGIHVVNLLTETKPGEKELIDRYHYHINRSSLHGSDEKEQESKHDMLRETQYDFHVETRGAEGYEAARMIRRHLEQSADGFAYFLSEEINDAPRVQGSGREEIRHPVVVLQQEGLFRTNCLDCLDRTNLVQGMISQMAIESFLSHRSETASSDFWMRHSTVWADNGDALSKIYAGTGALKSSFTRHGKMSLAGAIADVRKSATRLYVNNFADKGRQNTIDLLLGRLVGQAPVILFDPINDYVMAELQRHSASYSSSSPIRIWVGTFNLNGKTRGLQEDLSPWLCARSQGWKEEPEIMAIGFQEIVELSPQQIMATDPGQRQSWEAAVQRTINEHARNRGSDDYVLLRSGQLVGAALMIFVKAPVLAHLKNVEGSIKKTGLSGIAGNKGAVAIRFEFASTSLCFVTAHLAAGFANYEERNRDYRTISHGLRFQRNRAIADHDTIIWLGDFNYRVGLSDDRARKLVAIGDLETLYENDQLNLQMVAGLSFQYYSESRITFLPTYKFNLNSDEYDTSEKARIPAWTDRILRKGTNLKQIDYNSAPLRFSDHRPVYATFECTVTTVDEKFKSQLSAEIYARRREELGTDHAALDRDIDSDEDADLMGYDAIEPGLPPASSDRRKWWLDNGMPSRSTLTPPKDGMVPNPLRPSNPWSNSSNGEPAWIDPKDNRTRINSAKPQPPPPRRRTMVTPAWEGETTASGSSNTTSPATTERQNPLIPSSAVRRTSSTMSSTPSQQSVSRRLAPPIPKKPTSLTSPVTSPSEELNRSLSQRQSSHMSAKPLIPSSRGNPTSPPSTSTRPLRSLPPPQRSSSTTSTSSNFNPPLPPRTGTSSSQASWATAASDLPPPQSSSSSRPFSPSSARDIPPPPAKKKPQIPAPSSTAPPAIVKRRLPPPHTPTVSGSASREDGGGGGKEEEEIAPMLPPRRQGTNRGLMDQDSVEEGTLGDWEVLKPGR